MTSCKYLAALLVLFLCSCSTLPSTDRVVTVGAESSSLESHDTADEIGARVTYTERTTGKLVPDLSLAVSQIDGTFEGEDVDGERLALDLGVRYALDWGFLRPYLGAGLTAQHLSMSNEFGDKSEKDAGLYGLVGAEVPLGSAVLGVSYRHTGGIAFDDENLDVSALALYFGWGF